MSSELVKPSEKLSYIRRQLVDILCRHGDYDQFQLKDTRKGEKSTGYHVLFSRHFSGQRQRGRDSQDGRINSLALYHTGVSWSENPSRKQPIKEGDPIFVSVNHDYADGQSVFILLQDTALTVFNPIDDIRELNRRSEIDGESASSSEMALLHALSSRVDDFVQE